MSLINLSRPIRSERVRGFQPPWRTVFVYQCEHGHESRVYTSAFRGSNPEPAVGAIYCGQCEFLAKYPENDKCPQSTN